MRDYEDLTSNFVRIEMLEKLIIRGKMMKKLSALVFALLMAASVLFLDRVTVQASPKSASTSVQVVPTTKRVSKRVYRKGRWVTVTTWRHGKKISRKVWRKGNHIGRKVGDKTKDIVMGPKKPKP